jgi:UDP-N-acetylglucosamine---dolichyl-phosphate N-acetylglucosaminyltransferase
MPGPAELRLAVVIPAFQAGRRVAAVVTGVRREVPQAAVFVVDDGSTDGTAAAAAAAGATVTAHAANRGKGAALATGVERALSGTAEAIVTLDADGQHDPAAIPVLVAPLEAGSADLVLGARARTPAMPPQRRLSNWLSSVLASRVAGAAVPDAQTGFRAFRRTVAAAVRPEETGYDYELAFLLGAVAAGFRLHSVVVPTIYSGATSHFRHVADTWRVARVFARYGGRVLRG